MIQSDTSYVVPDSYYLIIVLDHTSITYTIDLYKKKYYLIVNKFSDLCSTEVWKTVFFFFFHRGRGTPFTSFGKFYVTYSYLKEYDERLVDI